MNCLWLILILACCSNGWGCGDCNCDQRPGRPRTERESDCGRRGRDDDCDCDDAPRRRPMPPFGRGNDNNDTCGCEIQED